MSEQILASGRPVERRASVRKFSDRERIRYWAQLGATWGVILGALFGPLSTFVPNVVNVGPADSIVAHACSAFEGALFYAAIGVLAAVLYHQVLKGRRRKV
jgi:hypothetical protein